MRGIRATYDIFCKYMDKKTKLTIIGIGVVVVVAIVIAAVVFVKKSDTQPQSQQSEQQPQAQQSTEQEVLRSLSAPITAPPEATIVTPKETLQSVSKAMTAPAPKGMGATVQTADQSVLDSLSAPAK